MDNSNGKPMKKCKYCQTEIDPKAKICPNCRKKQGMPKWAIFLIVIVVIGIFAASSGGSNSGNANNGNANNGGSSEKQEKFTYTVTNEYNNSFSHYIEGTVKNNRDKDYSYVQIEFICYDKDGNNLGTAIDNTNNLLGQQTWKFKAMGLFTDSTADHCDFHEVTGW